MHEDLNAEARSLHERWLADRTSRPALRDEARDLVERYRQELGGTFEGLSHEQIVNYVTSAREDGDEDAVARATVWALGAMPQQRVTGGN